MQNDYSKQPLGCHFRRQIEFDTFVHCESFPFATLLASLDGKMVLMLRKDEAWIIDFVQSLSLINIFIHLALFCKQRTHAFLMFEYAVCHYSQLRARAGPALVFEAL